MDMGGMSMGGADMFQSENMALAHDFWFIIAAILGAMLIFRGINFYKAQGRRRRCAATSVQYPTQPMNRFLEVWATITTIVREASYPQLCVPWRWLSWLTPPPLGRVLVLLVYWAVVVYMMTSYAVIKDAWFWERIGFRNAWVTITQIPLLYMLASKCSIIGIIAGSSYERFNWLHRWVARTMFVTATMHGWHFYSEWSISGMIDMEIQGMPMIKYGFGAWGILFWSIISSLAPFRRMAYELFVLQHIVSACVFLWAVSVHVPSYAQYNVWWAIAALCFDHFYRTVLLVWNNVRIFPRRTKCQGGQWLGHQAVLRAVGDNTTVVTVKDVHFRWRAGQHVYLWMPRLGPTEAHPYTIATAHPLPGVCGCNSIELVVRKHEGFSSRLHKFAARKDGSRIRGGTEDDKTATAFLTGPFGMPPAWDIFETLVLVSASTGASYTLPILESMLQVKGAQVKARCTRRIDFMLTSKRGAENDFYVTRLEQMVNRARDVGIELYVHVAITRSRDDGVANTASVRSSGQTTPEDEKHQAQGPAEHLQSNAQVLSLQQTMFNGSGLRPGSGSAIQFSFLRPDVEAFVRTAVETTGGETSVVVCGGPSLVARVRNYVAQLSDERAVHKGTGAQGIQLHVEEYCF